MKIQSIVLTSLASTVSVFAKAGSASLRRHEVEGSDRQLQAQGTLFNAITSRLLPVVNVAAKPALGALDPIAVVSETALDLPEFDVFGLCTAGANVNLKFLELSGFSSFSVDSLTLIKGTESTKKVPWWQGGGLNWNGNFTLVASMDTLKLESLAGVQSDACGMGLAEEEVSGNLIATKPTITTTLNIVGSSPERGLTNLFSSAVESIETSGTTITYESLDANYDGMLGGNEDLKPTVIYDFVLKDAGVVDMINKQLSNVLNGGLSFN